MKNVFYICGFGEEEIAILCSQFATFHLAVLCCVHTASDSWQFGGVNTALYTFNRKHQRHQRLKNDLQMANKPEIITTIAYTFQAMQDHAVIMRKNLMFPYGSCQTDSKRRAVPRRQLSFWYLELILVLGSQPAGDVSYKPGGRLPLLPTRPAVTPATLKRIATNFAAWYGSCCLN